MSIFGKIFSKIFPSAKAEQQPAGAATGAPSSSSVPSAQPNATTPVATGTPAAAVSLGDVTQILDAKHGADSLNWRTSIVDLLKLLELDSSLEARKELAKELNYTGSQSPGSAEWNMWLHRQVMNRIAANGGTVPADLRD